MPSTGFLSLTFRFCTVSCLDVSSSASVLKLNISRHSNLLHRLSNTVWKMQSFLWKKRILFFWLARHRKKRTQSPSARTKSHAQSQWWWERERKKERKFTRAARLSRYIYTCVYREALWDRFHLDLSYLWFLVDRFQWRNTRTSYRCNF